MFCLKLILFTDGNVEQSSQGQITVSPVGEKSAVVEKKATTPTSGEDQLRQWIDSYEEAVTNHYSPELRARIATIKVNGIHSDLKLPTNLMSTPKCRVSLLPSGIKVGAVLLTMLHVFKVHHSPANPNSGNFG